jgi:hypothetical protein
MMTDTRFWIATFEQQGRLVAEESEMERHPYQPSHLDGMKMLDKSRL